ncbi:MAG TPA: hypothetical protein PLO69_11255 [Gammaproteobacteria bacterium]|nr:hypothetical protein [Gammaproteobacteria bacterium]
MRFDEEKVRAATLPARICKAISAALTEAGDSREHIAARMSDFLGEKVSVNMLNAYASQARDHHAIGLQRFIALVHATRDRRLLELLAEQFDWAVIERKHLPMIELAMVQERQEELRHRAATLRQKAKVRGAL